MKKIMIVSGTCSAAIMSLGIFFKFMHWPGASLFIILGIALSSLVFVPLLFTLKVREKQNLKDKLVLGIGMVAGILISLAILFKVMHWPGANFMGILFIVMMVLVYIPVYFFSGIKHPDSKVNTIVSTIIMIMGSGLFLTLINTRPYIQEISNEVSNQALQESYITMSEQVRSRSLTAFTINVPAETDDLSEKCDAVCDRIEKLKLRLINETEAASFKSINYFELGKLDNYDVPSYVLFSEPDTDPKTGIELMGLKSDLKNLNIAAGKAFTSPAALIDLSDKNNVRTGVAESWEMHQFYHTPLGNVLRNLTQLQINIRFLQLMKRD